MALSSVTRLNKCSSKLAMLQWLALNLSIYLLLRAAGIPLRDRRLASLDSLAFAELEDHLEVFCRPLDAAVEVVIICIFSDFRTGGVAWTAFMDCACLLSSTVRQQMHCLQACPRESGWRQCSESCCQTAGVHVELARVAWTVHAQTVPRRAGKPAVRKPTHARLVRPVKPIPFPCFRSSSGCIESPTSLRKTHYKTPFPHVNESKSTINFVGQLILWKNRTNTAHEASPPTQTSCIVRGAIRAVDLAGR